MLCAGIPADAAGADEPLPSGLYARCAVLMDAGTGRILFAKHGDEEAPMASTTKIMTCILALEMGDPDDAVAFSENAARQPEVKLGAKEGETFLLKDLLYSLMLESHNDSAVAVAEHVGGSVEGFAALMNAKARDIGCYDTYFITPNGLDAEDENGVHSTTAADLARTLRYCICQSPMKEEFLKITRTNAYSFSDAEGLRSFTVGNKNAFLGMMEGALSGKTGFTNNAGYCYVGALERDGRTFIVALLACGWPNNRSYKWSDTRKLMSYGLEHYQYQNVWQDVLPEKIVVKNGIPESGDLAEQAYTGLQLAKEEPDLKLLMAEGEEVEARVELPEVVTAPVEPGTVVGSVCYYLNGTAVKAYPVEAADRAAAVDIRWCFFRAAEKFLL